MATIESTPAVVVSSLALPSESPLLVTQCANSHYDDPIIVLDVGSSSIKGGFSGEPHLPSVIVPSVLYRRKKDAESADQSFEGGMQKTCFGDDARRCLGGQKLSSPSRKSFQRSSACMGHDPLAASQIVLPLTDGNINSWDDVELLWNYTLKVWNSAGSTQFRSCWRGGSLLLASCTSFGLQLIRSDRSENSCESFRLAITEPVNPSRLYRERLLEWAFESHQTKAIVIASQPSMVLLAYGGDTERMRSGCILEIGEGLTQVSCISDRSLVHAGSVQRIPLAGRHITKQLHSFLGSKTSGLISLDDLTGIKHNMCRVSHDLNRDLKMVRETRVYQETYRLSDGESVVLEAERFMAPEILFNPGLFCTDYLGVAEIVFASISACPMDCRKELYQNILLAGGTTRLPGFASRLQHETQQLRRKGCSQERGAPAPCLGVQVRSDSGRHLYVYKGTSMYASLESPTSSPWITRASYAENGALNSLSLHNYF
eukprot:GHVQ01018506.1.p1 GENE.GHVQ01018506.1~~GHVQ01018506.1.p1  ORF type:complete len:487 (+),score=23.44 GHVQ01018506.1:398-1858(+)